MTIQPIPLSKSFFPNLPEVSVYDVVFPVVSISAEGKPLKIIGTCFALAECGLYATAAHLFNEFLEINKALRENGEGKKFHSVDHEDLINPDKMKCGIVHFHREQMLGITYVDALTMCVAHDVALLFAAHDNRGKRQPCLSIVESPSIGDDIRVVGYPERCNKMQIHGDTLSFDLALVDSAGKILEAFPEQRDKNLAFFPSFSTSASMRPGQSGGPVLDMAKMSVIGVNSRSIDGSDNYCIVSWLGKALDVPFSFNDVVFCDHSGKVIPVLNTTLRNLAEQGVISII